MRNFQLCLLILCLFGNACAPQRQAVPPGVIPTSQALTAADQHAGEEAQHSLKERFSVSSKGLYHERSRTIVDRLLRAADENPASWHLTVLEDDSIMNAAATRGNQIFIWTGMLQRLNDDGMLAAVLAHEIGHVLADHVTPTSQESLNRVIAGAAGAVAGHVASGEGANPQTAETSQALTQVLAQGFLVNPYTRRLELEADTIGMFLMADAGYNPKKAVELWRRGMSSSSSALPAFFSTHPPSKKRIENLTSSLPKAVERYRS